VKKIDYKKEHKYLYRPSAKKVEIIEVPKQNFLMIDGKGDPNTSEDFQEAVEALYALSYALKFMVKKGTMAIDYSVMPLEGLWWTEDMAAFSIENKTEWQWTLMILQPDCITQAMVDDAFRQVKDKKDPAALSKVRFGAFEEGMAAQTMHIGPFSEEGPTVDRVHDFIAANGYTRRGKHHEIYLSDIRRAAPEKWKTIIRQPILRS